MNNPVKPVESDFHKVHVFAQKDIVWDVAVLYYDQHELWLT